MQMEVEAENNVGHDFKISLFGSCSEEVRLKWIRHPKTLPVGIQGRRSNKTAKVFSPYLLIQTIPDTRRTKAATVAKMTPTWSLLLAKSRTKSSIFRAITATKILSSRTETGLHFGTWHNQGMLITMNSSLAVSLLPKKDPLLLGWQLWKPQPGLALNLGMPLPLCHTPVHLNKG